MTAPSAQAPGCVAAGPVYDSQSLGVVIELAGEPRGKGRPRSRIIKAKSGHSFVGVYTDAKTRSYEALLRDAAAQAVGANPLIDGPLIVWVTAKFSVPQSWSRRKKADALSGVVRPTGRPDVDNTVKLLDALNGIVWRDDSQIVECFVSKHYSDRPSLRIKVETAGGAHATS